MEHLRMTYLGKVNKEMPYFCLQGRENTGTFYQHIRRSAFSPRFYRHLDSWCIDNSENPYQQTMPASRCFVPIFLNHFFIVDFVGLCSTFLIF